MYELKLFELYNLKEMTLSSELFLSCSILQLTFYAIGTAYQKRNGFTILGKQVYSIGFFILLCVSLLLLNENLFSHSLLVSNHSITNDYLSFIAKLVLIIVSGLLFLIIKVTHRSELTNNNFEYVTFILISILGLVLLCSANDLITSYLTIELHSIAFYLLAAFKKDSSYSIESGLKYFITGALSSAFFLFGSVTLYGSLGSVNFFDFRLFAHVLANEIPSNEQFNGYGLNGINVKNLYEQVVIHFVKEFKMFPMLSEINVNINELQFIRKFDLNLSIHLNMHSESFDKINNKFDLILVNHSAYLKLSDQIFLLNDTLNLLSLKDNFEICPSMSFETRLMFLGLFFLYVSLFIKVAIAPFHLWSLDVYEGSPSSTTAFFATVPKIALFVILIRLSTLNFHGLLSTKYQTFFFLLALLSIFIGSFGGLEERKIKTILAYSSISHTGYLLLSLSANTVDSMILTFYYLTIFMVSGLCIWTTYLFIKIKKGFHMKKHSKELGDFVLLYQSNPSLSLILILSLFSIAGIPPFIGFLAKIGIFFAVIESSAYIIGITAILFSVVSTFYYIRIVKILYFENLLVGKLYYPLSTNKAIILTFFGLSLIMLSFSPTLIYLLFSKATFLLYY